MRQFLVVVLRSTSTDNCTYFKNGTYLTAPLCFPSRRGAVSTGECHPSTIKQRQYH